MLRNITKCCYLICMCSRNTKKAVNAPLPSLQVLIHCYWIRPISLPWIHIIPLCLVPQSCVQSIHFPPWPFSKVFFPFVQKPVKYTFAQYMQKKTPQDASLQVFTGDSSTKTCWPAILHLVVSSMGAESRSKSLKSVLVF